MSSSYEQTDQFLDELIQSDGPPPTQTADVTEAQILEQLVASHRAEPLTPALKQRMWQNAHAEATIRPIPQPQRPPSRMHWVSGLVAVVALVFAVTMMLMLPRMTEQDLSAAQQTPTVSAMPDPTATPPPVAAGLFDSMPQVAEWFGFAYGGYTALDASDATLEKMQDADMAWIAYSVTYDTGDSANAIKPQIEAAQERGFKVFLSVQGTRDAFDGLVEAHKRGYVGFVGQLAHMGADAIELWPGANIDGSWPHALGSESYAELLVDAAEMIRDANPETMIIFGAPIPTGAEKAYPEQVTNDDHFLERMRDSDALENFDCVGLSFVEGVVAPVAISGDPRDDYYTRYLPTMLQKYRSIVRAEIPLCVTTLGYFSGADLAEIPQGFQWGQSTTTAQQHTWLTVALEWLSLQSDVPLALVWHIGLVADTASGDEAYAQVQTGYDILR